MDIKTQAIQFIDKAKDFAGIGSKNLIGMDIGQSAIKFAEISFNGKEYKLESYSAVKLPEAAIIEDEINKEDEVVEAISEAFRAGNFSSKNICLGMSGPNTIARKLQLAGGDEEEIEDQVIWEAEQYLPFSIDDCIVDHFVVGENEGGGIDVMVAAARKDIILNFKALAEKAGLKVRVMDLSQLAICNIFELSMGERLFEEGVGTWIVLDIGAQKTELVIYKKGMPTFLKELNVGGGMITEEIQRQLGVNYLEAEDLKVTGDEQGNLPEEILEIMDDVVEVIFNEIKKTIDFYVSSTSDENFTGCTITGGSSLIPGLVEGLQALLSVEVEVMNPFDTMGYNKKYSEEVNDIAFKGATVLGLALRRLV